MQVGQIKNVHSANHLQENFDSKENDYLDQQPTFSLNSNTQQFKQQNEVVQHKSQSSRNKAMNSSYYHKVPHKNLRIDIGSSQPMIPECSNTNTFNKRNFNHFDDRKNSTRTDGDIRLFQNNFCNEDMRNDFRTSYKESSSITPKMGLDSIEEIDNHKTKPKKVKIKTSKSSNRIKGGESNERENAKIVITKDETNNVYHIIPKDSINLKKQTGKVKCIMFYRSSNQT